MSNIRKRAAIADRMSSLDGLRGIAGVIVVVFHLMSAVTPDMVPEYRDNDGAATLNPFGIFWNGHLAVSILFVVSGLVISTAVRRHRDPLWIDIPIRYLRLAIPATLSVIFAWFLLNLYPNAATELRAITGSRWLGWTYQGTIPNLSFALYHGLVDIFLRGGSFFNNPLWSMRPALFGSIACCLICMLPWVRVRLIIALGFGVAMLLSGRDTYFCFVFGLLIGEALDGGWLPSRFAVPALFVGLCLGTVSGNGALVFHLQGLMALLDPGTKSSLASPVAATLVVYGCMRSTTAISLLSLRFLRFLGEISFPMYLLHVPLTYTVMASFYVVLRPIPFGGILFACAYWIVLVMLSSIMLVIVERPLLGKLRDYRRWARNRLQRRLVGY